MSEQTTKIDDSARVVARLEQELKSAGVDALLIVSREDSDGVLGRIIDAHVVAQTAFFFRADGHHTVLTGATDAMAYEIYPFFREIITIEEGFHADFARLFDQLSPQRVALNICEDDARFDGLRWGLYQQIADAIGGERLAACEVSSADLLRRVFA